MARKTQKIDTTQSIKMQKIVKLKNYLDAQEQVLFKLYTDAAEKVNYREDDKVKKMRKVYETLESFSMNVYSEEFKVEIEWFDGFNGDIFTGKIDINSQTFCFAFMAFFNSLTYRIMATLQYYDPNGWCLNEFWKTRIELRTLTTEIFGYYGEKQN